VHLKLPYNAVVSEYQESSPLQSGDQVKVVGFEGVENLYGVLANIKDGHGLYVFSLCDLKAVGKNQPITP
jgi:hypothetical protein